MHKVTKIVVAVVVIALIAVIGLIFVTKDQGANEPAAAATAEPSAEPTATAEPVTTEEPQDEAQGTMYEGALAGLTEEEIAALALAEEAAGTQHIEESGAEGAVD